MTDKFGEGACGSFSFIIYIYFCEENKQKKKPDWCFKTSIYLYIFWAYSGIKIVTEFQGWIIVALSVSMGVRINVHKKLITIKIMLNPNPYSSSITLPRFQPDLFSSSKWPTHSHAFIAEVKIKYILFLNAFDENYSHIFFSRC